MDKMSLVAFLSVSIPEEFLLAVTTAFLDGRKDILKSLNGWGRVLLTTLLTATFVYILRSYSSNMTINLLVQLVFFIFIYIMVLRLNKFEAIIGFMLVTLFQFVLEIANVLIVTNLTFIGLEQVYSSDMIRFLYSLPTRILQLSAVIVLYKSNFHLNLRDSKFIKKLKYNYSIVYLCAILATIDIAFLFKKYLIENSIYQAVREPILWISLALIVTMIFTIIKFINQVQDERREQVIKLAYVKDLLSECKGDIISVNKEIDELMERIGRTLR